MKLGIFGSKVLSVIESCLFVRSTAHYMIGNKFGIFGTKGTVSVIVW